MPYFFDVLQTPNDEDHLWQRLEEIWLILHDDLMGVRFETEEEAIEGIYRKSLDPNDMRLDSLFLARYRDTDDRENLLFFHDRGLEALGTTEQAIKDRRLNTEFLTEWSVLLSCHGFVTAAVMARGPDVEGKRAGRAGGQAVSVDQQRIWFSHYFVRHYDRRIGREAVESAIEALVNQLARDELRLGLSAAERKFFGSMLSGKADDEHRFLKDTYRERKLSIRQMRGLAQQLHDDLPCLGLKLHLPRVRRSQSL